MIGTSYWAFFGIVQLVLLTYKDFKNNMNVDDRHNWFMLGISVSLLSHFNHGFLYCLSVMVVSLFAGYMIKKINVLGDADVSSITWIFIGLAILNIYALLWFFIIFLTITLIYWTIKKYILRIKFPTPFYLVILISFLINSFMWGLF